METNFPTQNVQAFMGDLILMAETKLHLEKILSFIHKLIIDNQMELNLKKCEYLSPSENETITDPLTKTIFYSQKSAKYLGQVIDNEGRPTNIINKFNFSEISNIIKTASYQITRRAKLKLFSTYIKSKFSHLIPLLALQGDLEQTWINIRKSLFKEIIDFSTMPREAGSLIGISFYSIIIKPILKLYEKELKIDDEEMKNFMIQACKNAFKIWIKMEQNNTEKIKELINDLISNNKLHELNVFEKNIYNEAAQRLFKDKNIPKDILKLTKLKLPMLIELASNNFEHLIIDTIKQKIIDKDTPKEEIGRIIMKPIMKYIGLYTSGDYEPPKIQKLSIEDINELLDYQQIYDFK